MRSILSLFRRGARGVFRNCLAKNGFRIGNGVIRSDAEKVLKRFAVADEELGRPPLGCGLLMTERRGRNSSQSTPAARRLRKLLSW
ncbi:MAG: hypothetical protein LBU65_02475 [Planctomycetaceae bacterium]|nr:hypothetical protein [Planctomycetaceae bacterium]